MSAPSVQLPREASDRRPYRVSRSGVLILGVIVVPFVLSAALNNSGGLTEEGAVRMAFATVAGQTVATLSAVAVIVITVMRRADVRQLALVVLIAMVILMNAIGLMSGAGDILLDRLDLIAETNELYN